MFPLKSNFVAGLPLASLEASWLRTVANILNDIDGIGCHIEKTYGGEGMGWKIIVDTDLADLEYPFKITDNGGGSVDVKGGSWTRNGTTVTLADTTLESLGADDYVCIYLISLSGTVDPALDPYQLSVSSASSIPADGFGTSLEGYNVVCILGKFTAGVWEQYWKGGNIDDLVLRPDGDPYDSTGRSTIVLNPESGRNKGELQVGDVHLVKASSISFPFFPSDDSTPVQGDMKWAFLDAHDGTSSSQKSLEIVGTDTGTAVAQLVGFDTPDLPTDPFDDEDSYSHHFGLRETDGSDTAMKWYAFADLISGLKADSLADETWIESLGDSLDGYINWDDVWNSSVSHTGIDFSGSTSAKGTGLSGGNTDHDDSYWHEFGTDFIDTKTFKTSGEVWASAFRLQGDDENNKWDATQFEVKAVSFYLTATDGTCGLVGNGSGQLYIGGEGGEQAFEDILFNGDAGVDIANWTTKGGLTGTDIIEVEAQDIQPTDKVLVRR